jgi:hypothetical protein
MRYHQYAAHCGFHERKHGTGSHHNKSYSYNLLCTTGSCTMAKLGIITIMQANAKEAFQKLLI